MIQALIIAAAVVMPIGLYFWHERRSEIEDQEHERHRQNPLNQFRRWDDHHGGDDA